MSDESQSEVLPEAAPEPAPPVIPVEPPPVVDAPAPAPVEVAPESVPEPVPAPVPEVKSEAQPYWNSYKAGIALGLVLLAAFFFTGRGLGASGAVTRMAAYSIQKVEASLHGGTAAEADTIARHNTYTGQYLKGPADPLDDFLVYMFVGVVVGGFISGVLARRASFEVSHGPHSNVSRRLMFAALGGFVSAFGARLARGCTSGQALTGGATLALGSWVFMLAVFAGGYAIAYFVRKEWI
ncbi:MAG: YeeE/YedE thiosulfate transporter family protein [Archangium sp.]|nr:YeeE/YedE thiosulfate transporter family protein [Archangium sp.]